MSRLIRCAVLSGLMLGSFGPQVLAQTGQLGQGFERVAPAIAGGQELLSQPQLWIYETHLKKMRMIRLDVKDPETGKTSREWIWYLVYRVVNRDLGRPTDETDTTPINDADPQPPEMFIPEFELVILDEGASATPVPDQILPDVQAEIMRRERLTELKNPVQIIGPVLPVAADGEDAEVRYGVAIWRGIDPRTDNFRVYLTGFSNGYALGMNQEGKPVQFGYQQTTAAAGDTPLPRWRKTLVQDFWRPGDEFEQDEMEIRFQGDLRWEYRLDDVRETAVPIERPSTPAAG